MLEQKVLKPPLYERVIDCRWMAKKLTFQLIITQYRPEKIKKMPCIFSP